MRTRARKTPVRYPNWPPCLNLGPRKPNSKLLWHRLEKGCWESNHLLNTTFKGEEGEGKGARQLSSLAVPGHPVKDTSRRPRRTWCAARGLTPSADAAMSAGFVEGKGRATPFKCSSLMVQSQWAKPHRPEGGGQWANHIGSQLRTGRGGRLC